MKTRPASSFGFNLVEMSIALVVVAIGIMSVAAIFPDQLQAVRKTADRAQMSQFAQSVDGVLRAIGAAGQDLSTLSIPGLPPGTIVLPPVGGGIWTSTPSAGGASPAATIKLDIIATALGGNPTLPPPAPGQGGGLQFVDIANGNYANQSLWYHIHVQPLPASDAAGHRVVIYVWRSDGTVQPGAAVPPAEQYITEIYKY